VGASGTGAQDLAAPPRDNLPIAATIDVADTGPTLHVDLLMLDTTCRLTLQGSLNASTLAVLEAHFDILGLVPCHDVVVDLRHLAGLDGVGANVLLGLYYYVIARGGVFHVSGAGDEVAALLRSVGEELMPLDDGSYVGLGGSDQ
jgi:anti-anti-sigma regulatory factor